MTSKLNDNLSFLACHIHSAILVVVKGKSWINCVRYFNCYLVLKERHVRRESNAFTLGLCIAHEESRGCTGLDSSVVFRESVRKNAMGKK